ncbi:GLPGLI family protein [Chryseobacterium pennipullorum]|uniref:GLPGLI family protein n=1 Tax=Chryseobacterium pennipullorum TaxID=2258963 RepID=A0A3D9AS91_9FLAO|nr:GLPGLI family protein [Chryseobacterium pennipullorum]REC44200.1 GLPGLI family protein [Chryseobacterium pennipullorum]
MAYSEKLIGIVFLFLFVSLFSQHQRFTYDYQYIPDSTRMQDKRTEIMYLDVAPGFSRFFSGETFKNDSISKAITDKQMKATGRVDQIPQTAASKNNTIRYTVIKNYSDHTVFFLTRMGRSKYNVSDRRTMSWSIHPDKEVIKGYAVQKATTDFGGRKWTAWFTADIPVQDGPYKFHGLPGMILKIEDAGGSHSFTLAGIRKLSDLEIENLTPSGSFVFDFGDKVDIDFPKYRQIFLESRNDPTKSLRMTLHDLEKVNVNGTMIDKSTYLRERELQMKKTIQDDNNIIEIDMLKK